MDESTNPWKILAKKEIYDNPWIRITEFDVINPTGGKGIYGKVHYKNIAIGIFALDEEWNTWLVGQYRFPIDKYSWEMPEGGGPLHIDPLESAKRELKEETGFSANSWDVISRVYLSNSVSDEYCIIYLAQDLIAGVASLEETEDITSRKISFDEVYAMVNDGRIDDVMTVTAVQKIKLMMLEGKLTKPLRG